MNDDTPTTDEVRAAYADAFGAWTATHAQKVNADFDRWLAEHDRRVAEKALQEVVQLNLGWRGA